MNIRVHVLLCIENEKEVVVEEEIVSQAEIPPVGNNFYFDTCGTDPEPPTTQGNPRCIYVAEQPESFQLKCPSHASEGATHLNRNNQSVPQI
jgi:hypothetical protein